MQVNLYTKQKQTHRHKKTNVWLPKGKGKGGKDKLGIWGLTNTNYYIQNI